MKKLLIAAVVLLASSVVKADDSKIHLNIGTFTVYLPFQTVSGVGLWDFVGKRGMAGAETPLAQWRNIQFVGGGVTSLDGEGSPFVGAHLYFVSPAENFVPLSSFHPGLFGGRDFRNNSWILGLKASVGLF